MFTLTELSELNIKENYTQVYNITLHQHKKYIQFHSFVILQ